MVQVALGYNNWVHVLEVLNVEELPSLVLLGHNASEFGPLVQAMLHKVPVTEVGDLAQGPATCRQMTQARPTGR